MTEEKNAGLDAFVAKMMEEMDVDKSGYLNLIEVQRYLRLQGHGQCVNEQDAKEFLGMLDKNMDGKLSPEEVKGYVKCFYK
ncbi:hypothetical protein Ciccas_003571 [Cichlidogyrus casuarinus]|uniref:EF-hand domain-containing protein n=1 Tax=Cichlidogyrus casuarinus TaxID=1844966 RepID=A0ABD2QEW3_9PLAT